MISFYYYFIYYLLCTHRQRFFIHITWQRFICLLYIFIHTTHTTSYTWRKEHWPNSMFFWLRLLMTDNLLKSEAHGRHTYLLKCISLYYSTFFLSGTYKIFFKILQGISLYTKTTIVWIVSPLFFLYVNQFLSRHVCVKVIFEQILSWLDDGDR